MRSIDLHGVLLGLLLPVLIGAVGCRSSTTEPERQPTPGSAADVQRGASEQARQIVEWLGAGKTADVRSQFDDAMNKAFASDAALAQVWTSVEAMAGTYRRVLAVTETEHDQRRIVLVTCEFERMPMDVKLVFDESRRIAGMHVTPAQHAEAWGPRPQTPSPPFAYQSRDVTYETKGKATIAGTLTTPAGKGPFPALLLITGSGAQDRDETLFGHKPFLVISDRLTKRGIAVLRVDDRGVGKSSAEDPNATIETHAADVEAGIEFLKRQEGLDPTRLGLVGHSEGGIIAAVVAARSRDVAFLVSLAGTGVSGAEINPMQVEAILRATGGVSEATVKVIADAQRKLMRAIAEDADKATLTAAFEEIIAVTKRHAPPGTKDQVDQPVESLLAALEQPWFRSFVKLDPRAHWSKVTVPVLALNGDKDTQVPADVNLAAIKDALAKARNPDVTLEKLPGLNHLFQPAVTGTLDEYGKIETTFDAGALELMTEWVVKRARPESGSGAPS